MNLLRRLLSLLQPFKATAPPAEPVCPVYAQLLAENALLARRHAKRSHKQAALNRRVEQALWAGMGMTDR